MSEFLNFCYCQFILSHHCLPNVLRMLFLTPSPSFLGGFLSEFSIIFSSDHFIISRYLIIHSPFCWVWRLSSRCRLSFCLLEISLAESFSWGVLSGSVLLRAIALTVFFAVARPSAVTSVLAQDNSLSAGHVWSSEGDSSYPIIYNSLPATALGRHGYSSSREEWMVLVSTRPGFVALGPS